MKKWLELVVDTAKQSYSELFNREPDVSIHVVERDKWKEELEKSGAWRYPGQLHNPDG